MRKPETVILDWTRSTAASASEWLIASAPAGTPVDLSDVLVLVSTQQAGRRLREALVRLAPGNCLLAPRVLTPSALLMSEDASIASPAESLLTLSRVLGGAGEMELSELFPSGNPFRTFAQRIAFGREFLSLRETVADAGLDIPRTAERLGEGHPDGARWGDLIEIERRFRSALRRLGKRDRQDARLATDRLDMNAGHIVLLGIADLSPIAERLLGELPESVRLSSLVIAEDGLAERFDCWGRPLETAWDDRDPGWEDFDRMVHLAARPSDAAAVLRSVIPADEPPAGDILEIGLLNRDLLPELKDAIGCAGGSLHNPEGERLERHWLTVLLSILRNFCEEPRFTTVAELIRNVGIIAWLGDIDLTEVLADADRLAAKHFPATCHEALRWSRPELRGVLRRLIKLRESLLDLDWPVALGAFLEETLKAADSRLDAAMRNATGAGIEALASVLVALAEAPVRVDAVDGLHFLSVSLAEEQWFREGGQGAVQTSGWLELPWSDAPHLFLAGFNQGCVPAPVAQSPFLRESDRAKLGLATQARRAARDLYFLARLLAMRRKGRGRVDVAILQIGTDGAPLNPSPMLFCGCGDDLPGRVRRLFADPGSAQPDPAWHAGWWMTPPVAERPRRVRVTDFARYLDCPFRFYLREAAGMEPYDAAPAEMDARLFGTLVHHAVEVFGRDTAARELDDPKYIREILDSALDDYISAQFGGRPSLSLMVQIESARRRLAAFADAQSVVRREGWRIEHVEISFEDLLGRPWLIDGWEIRGKIDRIDIHPATGRWRVLDYKTGDKAEAPERKHLRQYRKTDRVWPPDYARFANGKVRWWTNLQLPLYRALLVELGLGAATVECGYFNLPRTIAETRVELWAGFDEALGLSAMACARGVLGDIGRHRFWPPNPDVAYDELEEFLQPSAEAVIDPQGAFCDWARPECP
jgi:ATP-dependent helicase/nuclease subunit B